MRNLRVSYINDMDRGIFFVKKKTRRRTDILVSRLLILLLLPLICTVVMQQMQIDQLFAGIESGMNQENKTSEYEEELLLCIVAKEIAVTAEPEAIRAQCVIARTNLYDAWEKGGEEPASFSLEELRQLWGENFTQYCEELEGYITSTESQVLAWEGKCIYAAYHAVSAGETRNMAELYPDVQMPYLVSVECHADARAAEYLSVYVWDREEFEKLCEEYFPEAFSETSGEENAGDAPEDAIEKLRILSRDSAGYVLEIALGEEQVEGETFRNAFGLPSSCFSVSADESKVRIVTKGSGHGLGLSQYTAEKMAAEGSTYEEILDKFYPGTELLTYKP